MSDFDNADVDQAFFSGTRMQSNFICSIGYGKVGTPYPRNLKANPIPGREAVPLAGRIAARHNSAQRK
jgi:hypothetical protein